MVKYRVHEVAKDLNLQNKDVLDIVNKYAQEPKKYMTALEEDELNYIFDSFTQSNSVDSLNAYYNSGKPKKANNDRRPAQRRDNNAPRQDFQRRDNNAPRQDFQRRDNNAPRQDIQRRDNNAPRQDFQRRDNNAPRQDFQRRDDRNTFKKPAYTEQKTTKPAPVKPAVPKAIPTRPAQTSSANGDEIPQTIRRVVDTRTSNVNIDKYNERYDNLAYDKVKNETTAAKQKINSRRNQRNRRQGKRETESERLQRIASERKAKAITITIPEEITVGEFALRLKATSAEVIKKLMLMGTFATINDTIDFDTAELIADEFHAKVEREVVVTIEERIIDDSADDTDNLQNRAPVVVVMGHVDHGKTSLLDAIRHSEVTAGEAGGITQHIGAYRVNVDGREITFLDTPGHAAFTTMRARGAQVTDIAVLVVAADDGIMPQTIEAINHAKAAGVSIIVAVNKMDKPAANPDRVLQQLTEYELVPETWGGDVPCIPLSAVTKQGIDELMEMILLTADMKELMANPDRAAKGTVIEARLDKGRGPIATVLVQNGTLSIGDIIVAGTTVGRVR
ncbi:MAG: translation initiation factor IF-2, partial [Clostridia bacterium]